MAEMGSAAISRLSCPGCADLFGGQRRHQRLLLPPFCMAAHSRPLTAWLELQRLPCPAANRDNDKIPPPFILLRRYIYYQHPFRITFLSCSGFLSWRSFCFSLQCKEILCLLETEDMFFAASILCYMTIMLIQILLYGVFCSAFYLNHERRDEEIDDMKTLYNLKNPPKKWMAKT
mgnify:CR=1 FL=1